MIISTRFFTSAASLLCAASLIFIASCSKDEDEPKVVVNEDLYINEVYSSGEDWIELYNAGATTKDISGFSIYDDPTKKYIIPAGTSIPSLGYLIFVADDTGTGLHTNFKLSSDGETVYIENKIGVLVDKVEFPAMSNGQSYGRYPDGSAVLKVSGNTTRGESNGDSQAPAIADVTHTPAVPGVDDEVTVQAELVSNTNIASVKLFYRFNGAAFTEVPMTLAGSFYNGVIPAQHTTGLVEYYIEAKNNANQSSRHPNDAPDDTHDYLLNTDALPQLVINEFMASNQTCCPDTDSGADEFDDWIEIYNAGPEAVNLAGMYLSDDKTKPFGSKISSDNAALTTIQPNGYLVLWADGTKEQGPRHLNFSLAKGGEDVSLFYIDGRLIDAYTFPAQDDNVSTGRTTDGANTWKVFTSATQGAKNQ